MDSSKKRALRRVLFQKELHENAFALIYKYLTASDTQSSRRLRRKSHIDCLREALPLVSVCQAWRRASLPTVYGAVVCSIKQLAAGKGYSVRSNLGLIAHESQLRHVHRLVIDLVGDVPPDTVIGALEEHGFGARAWYDIEAIEVNHWHGHILTRPKYESESLARFNSYILHHLPKLVSVQYNSSDDRRYYPEFPLDGLLASRLSQLQEVSIASGIIPRLGSSAFLPGLTVLKLQCPVLPECTHLPRIFANSLEHLHLGFSSAESIWNRFYSDKDTRVVEFKNLNTLVLEYVEPRISRRKTKMAQRASSLFRDCNQSFEESDDSENDEYGDTEECIDTAQHKPVHEPESSRFVFPQLHRLAICKYPRLISRVLKYFMVDQIPAVSIRDVAKGWSSIQATSLAQISSLHIHLSQSLDTDHSNRQYQRWINQLFSISAQMTSLRLDAQVPTQITLPDIIGLVNLVKLSLSIKLDLGSLPNLLSRLPHLRRLATHLYPTSSWSLRNDGVLGNTDYRILLYIPPLSRSLEVLVAYIDSESDSTRPNKRRLTTINEETDSYIFTENDPLMTERELALVIARIPSLRQFKSQAWTSRSVSQCIGEILA
ncbi:hypothetical protein GGI07_004520, partial [Coemansia sp. Benny D115]